MFGFNKNNQGCQVTEKYQGSIATLVATRNGNYLRRSGETWTRFYGYNPSPGETVKVIGLDKDRLALIIAPID